MTSKKYWSVFLLCIVMMALLFTQMPGPVKPAAVGFAALWLGMISILLFIGLRRAKIPVMSEQGGKIVIRGVMRRLDIEMSDMERLEIKTNFVCTVLDWSLMVIAAGGREYRIYTRRIKNPGVSLK